MSPEPQPISSTALPSSAPKNSLFSRMKRVPSSSHSQILKPPSYSFFFISGSAESFASNTAIERWSSSFAMPDAKLMQCLFCSSTWMCFGLAAR